MKIKAAAVSAIIALTLLATPAFAQSYTRAPFPTPRKTSALTQEAMRSCQAKEAAVKTRVESLTNLATNMEKVFDSITTRVENFYTASGKSVSNYDALVADIGAKKNVVDTDLATARSQVASFSCSADNPRELLVQFRINMQKVKSDLKDYRTSIKKLIVAVRPLAPKATGSAKPTPTP